MAVSERLANPVCGVIPNHTFNRTGWFLRFSGHPELTLQEVSHADAWPPNDVPIQQ